MAQGFITPQVRLDMIIVGNIVAMMSRAAKDWAEPNSVRAEFGDIVQLFGDTPERSPQNAIQIIGLQPSTPLPRIKTIHEDLIDDSIARPTGRFEIVN